ncbi:hypothetical protein M2323_003819 [Rhodoblastus acidophilus]|uniref:GDCCVxC domain-containing (seleno)protein n=1 Tax=Rhodoblastus acidophilus TaxID=1074 RepID=UPI0022245DEA|nr:GDCCVxC domain-containing (seleno)protein [Rhodoblastus acidophilus]MCW2285982.1 hypothetical protein [Rhodoblastus acidophilus]MCW2334876.1 hypothetical protein [Rhodoblastus acidophilus]
MDTLSTLKCPTCYYQAIELMPTDRIVDSYQCKGCGTVLRAKPGQDCVFCSYGDVPCPPVQARRTSSAEQGTCCGACGG